MIRRTSAVVLAASLLATGACRDGGSHHRERSRATTPAPRRAEGNDARASTVAARAASKRTPRLHRLVSAPRTTAATATTGPTTCATTTRRGGDWPSLNGDHANTRAQEQEQSIDATNAKDLRPAWAFTAESVGATGGMRTTPIVAYGCVYVAFGEGYLGDRGDVVALNADTGALVWHAQITGSVLGLAAANGLVYATPSNGTRGDVELPVVNDAYKPRGSYAIAMDATTGALRWTSARLDDGHARNGTFINASPVVFDAGGERLVFVPLAGGAGDGARVPMYFLDALTGATRKRTFSLSEANYAAGFGGTGIWSTAAYEASTQYLYAGTADSDGHTRQHPYNNALLKIDANPRRATFGTVTAAYTGTTEHANLDPLIGYPHNPVCGVVPEGATLAPPTFLDTSASPECVELDFDFGASPNLYTDRAGHLTVAALQKSGVFHTVDAATMRRRWTFFAGPGGGAMDGGTAALAGHDLFVGATPNLVFRLDDTDGTVGWTSTTGPDVFAYQPVSVANGVVYAITDFGVFVGLSAATGAPLVTRAIATDGGFSQCFGVGAGVAVAHNTVFVPCDAGANHDVAGLPGPPGGLVAYRLSASR